MSESLGLGKIITTEQHRDAVHVAVAPVVAAQDGLVPGRHIGIISGDTAGVVDNPIGIVDPFLACSPKKGERFWMYLYPGSITSLRHDWTHPAFNDDQSCKMADKASSEAWLRMFCERTDCPRYEELIAGIIGDGFTNKYDDYVGVRIGATICTSAETLRLGQFPMSSGITWKLSQE